MSDQTAVWLLLGLLVVQLFAFVMSALLWFTGSRQKDAAVREKLGYQSNFWSAAGFACMTALAFTCQSFVEAGRQWKTWAAALVFMLFAAFLFWLGKTRRRLLKQKQASSE